MKHTTYICDRCGKEYSNHFDIARYFHKTVSLSEADVEVEHFKNSVEAVASLDGWSSTTTYDLCSDCRKSFKRWLIMEE